jgi:hypothetical protein
VIQRYSPTGKSCRFFEAEDVRVEREGPRLILDEDAGELDLEHTQSLPKSRARYFFRIARRQGGQEPEAAGDERGLWLNRRTHDALAVTHRRRADATPE